MLIGFSSELPERSLLAVTIAQEAGGQVEKNWNG